MHFPLSLLACCLHVFPLDHTRTSIRTSFSGWVVDCDECCGDPWCFIRMDAFFADDCGPSCPWNCVHLFVIDDVTYLTNCPETIPMG